MKVVGSILIVLVALTALACDREESVGGMGAEVDDRRSSPDNPGSVAEEMRRRFPKCDENVSVDCVASADFPAARPKRNCDLDGETDCLASESFPAADVAGAEGKIAEGRTLAGREGAFAPAIPPTDKVLVGIAVGDSVGTYAPPLVCSGAGAEACLLASGMTAADKSSLMPGNIRIGVSVGGVDGSLPTAPAACVADGETGCVTGGQTRAVLAASLVAGDIRKNVSVAGVVGTLIPAPASCSAGGQTACVAEGSFVAADAAALSPGLIKNGATVAGVVGQFPSASFPLSGAAADADLVSLDATVAAGSYEWWDSAGTRHQGAIADAGVVTPGAADQLFQAAVYRGFTVAGDPELKASNIVSGRVLFGVSGSAAQHPQCVADGEIACVTSPAFRAADMTAVLGVNLRDGVTVAGVTGSLVESPVPCLSDGGVDCVANAAFKAADMSNVLGANVRSGVTIAGISGSVLPAPADCAADGAVGCVATPYFKAADLASFSAASIVSGSTIAGVTGSASASPAACSADGQTSCVATLSFKAVDMSHVAAPNILWGVTIAGVSGSAIPSPSDCMGEDVNCVARAPLVVLNPLNLSPGIIKVGAQIGGVMGQYPSATYPLGGASATVDLPSLSASVAAGEYEWWKADGTRVSGFVADAGTVTPGTADQTFQVSVYRAFTVAGDGDLIASNIQTGTTLFGISGSLVPSPAVCAADGAMGCVANSAFRAADMTNVLGGNIRTGVTIAGVSGAVVPTPTDCSSDGETACVATSVFKAADTSAYAASDLVSGKTVAGVAGALANCFADGQTGCVTTSSFQALSFLALSAGNIKSGVTIAGVTGAYPSVAHPLGGASATEDLSSLSASVAAGSYEWWKADGTRVTGSISDAGTVTPGAASQSFTTSVYRQFTVAGDSDLTAANVKNGVDVFGVSGTLNPVPADCAADGAMGCVATSSFKAANMASVLAGNILTGISIAGVAGSASQAPAACSADGETSCVANSSFKAANMTNVLAGNVRSSVVIAGVTGSVAPTPADCAADGATSCVATSSFKAANMANVLAGNIRSSVTIAGVAGSVTAAPSNCSSDGQTSCVANSSYKAANMTNVVATNVKAGVTIAGVAGSVTSAPANCSSDGAAGCVTTSTYKSADTTAFVASDLLSGHTVAGVAGTLGQCASDGQQSCVVGGIFKAANVTGWSSYDLRVGMTIAGVAGTLKYCRSSANTSHYNNTSSPAVAGLDVYDTVDDYNFGVAGLPTGKPFGDAHFCDASVWQDLTQDGLCNSTGDQCRYKDRMTNLIWSEDRGSMSWTDALTYCANSTSGGWNDWRLPTLKEMQQAAIDGIVWVHSPANFINTDEAYWSSTTSSNGSTSQAYQLEFDSTVMGISDKSASFRVTCVRGG